MSEHTPEPWTWDKGDAGIERPEPYSTVSAGDTIVAEINSFIPEGEANALLIKAAPSLLAACKKSADTQCLCGIDQASNPCHACVAARAVAAAEGRS